MVPIPVWTERPSDPLMTADLAATTGGELPTEPRPFLRNVSGRAHKAPHKATVRTQAAGKLNTSWEKRQVTRKKDEAVKAIEKEMKDEKAADILRKKTITKERNIAMAEKARLEEMATRMSARKLQRMKKRLGRTKKISA